MFRPFADPLLAAAECRPPSRLSPSRHSPSRHSPSQCVSQSHTGAAAKQTAFLVRSGAQSTCGKAPPSSMSCREAAAPWLVRYGVAHLLSCAATSMIDRGRRLTDEAFRTRFGKLSAGSSGCLFHVFAPVWHSGALLRASNRRGRASRVDSCRNPNRSWATIQAIFCVSDLCKAHDGSLAERLVTGSPKAHAAHQIDRDMGSRPQAQLLKKVLPPRLLARRRAPQQSCFRGRAAVPHQ